MGSLLRRLALGSLVALVAAAAPPTDRVILKSGRELVGKFGGSRNHRVYFVDDELGAVVVPRLHVRTVVRGDADPDLFAPIVVDAPATALPASFVRYEAPAAGKPGALSTAVARFFDEKTRTTVFLVGAVHIAEADYYERVQDLLDGCDVVLFEGVGHSDGGAPAKEEELARYDALFRLQLKLNSLLGLTFQKDGLDYKRDFWKNADVSMERLSAQMEAKGVGLPTDPPLIRALLGFALGMLDATQVGDNPLFRAQLKRQVAAALGMADALMGQQMKPLSEVLIDWRNDAALQHLDAELAAGPKGRWIAVFYGAGHLPDLARKLTARGLEAQGVDWLRAWNVE